MKDVKTASHKLTWQGVDNDAYKSGGLYSVFFSPMSGSDRRLMCYKRFSGANENTGYKVYSNIDSIKSDWNLDEQEIRELSTFVN